MQDRKGRKVGRKEALKVVGREQEDALRVCFSAGAQYLLPLLKLIRDAKASVGELMKGAACRLVEQLLAVSAQEVVGPKHPGRRGGEVRWLGSQAGHFALAERKLAIVRPLLRRRKVVEVASRPMPASRVRQSWTGASTTPW